MALRVLGHRREPVLLEDELPTHNVVMFDPRLERSFEPLLNRLRVQDLARGALDLLVVRTSHPGAVDEIERDAALAEFLTGIPTLVLAAGHDADAPAPAFHRPAWSATGGPELATADLRGAELQAMLRRSSAIFHHEGFHYALPSAAVHAAEFIRLADALQDATDLVRIADWVLPLLQPGSGLAADTGTLLGLMATLRYEAVRRFGWDIPIAALDEYPRGASAVQELLRNFMVAGWDELVFLVSVNSTGAVARYVVADQPGARVVALCETAIASEHRADRASDDTTVFVEQPVERWPLGADRRCEQCEHRQILHIHPRTYELTTELRWSAVGFAHEQLSEEREFWAIADRMDAVELHVDRALSMGAHEDVRHLAVGLDIDALLSDAAFFERARTILEQRYPQPDVVLIPEHAATEALRRLANAVWDAPVHAIALGPLEGEARAAVAAARDVLVMDDVAISTLTLFGLRMRVYEVSQAEQQSICVWGFVAVARPPEPHDWNQIRKRYMTATDEGMRHSLYCAQQLSLPAPGNAACASCRERVLLQRTLPSLSGQARARARERELVLQRTPLRPPLGIGGVAPDARTVDSMVGDLRPRAAFAAAAAHAQHLKCTLNARRHVSQLLYFDIALLLEVIFDAAMFAGILRTLDARNVRDPTGEIDLVACMAGKEWPTGMLAELAIAAADGKLPADTVLAYLGGPDGDGTLEMLRALAQYS